MFLLIKNPDNNCPGFKYFEMNYFISLILIFLNQTVYP